MSDWDDIVQGAKAGNLGEVLGRKIRNKLSRLTNYVPDLSTPVGRENAASGIDRAREALRPTAQKVSDLQDKAQETVRKAVRKTQRSGGRR